MSTTGGMAAPDPPSVALLLQVPADAVHVATVRLFAAAVARHFGAGEERIHDLKLGVSEACTLALDGGASGEPVQISVGPAGPKLTVTVSRHGRGQPGSSTGPPDDMGLRLIEALFEDPVIDQTSNGVVIAFSIPLDDDAEPAEPGP